MSRHARTVCRALSESGVSVRVLSLLDPVGSRVPVPGITQLAFGGNRRQFAANVLNSAISRPRLVVAQHASFSSLAWAAAQLARSRLVVFAHGIEVWNQLPLLRRLSLRRADLILCVSHHTTERAAVANQLDPRRLRILPNCLDPDISFNQDSSVRRDELSLLTVGRMSQEEGYKGHNKVLQALPTLLPSFPGLRYDIVGGGDGRPVLEEMARELGLSEIVHFHGLVPEPILLDMYRRASVFVMPSEGEGFGLAFIEAMAFGTPVIASHSGASAEIVRHDETGLLVDSDGPLDLETALHSLLRDKEYRDRLGRAAQKDVQYRFGFPQYREGLLALFRGIGLPTTPPVVGLRTPS